MLDVLDIFDDNLRTFKYAGIKLYMHISVFMRDIYPKNHPNFYPKLVIL